MTCPLLSARQEPREDESSASSGAQRLGGPVERRTVPAVPVYISVSRFQEQNWSDCETFLPLMGSLLLQVSSEGHAQMRVSHSSGKNPHGGKEKADGHVSGENLMLYPVFGQNIDFERERWPTLISGGMDLVHGE